MIQAICRVLIHSLWQGVLLAVAGGVVVQCTRRSAPAMRYQFLCGLFFLFLGIIGLTFFYEWNLVTRDGAGAAGVGVSVGWLKEYCSAHAVWIVTIWLAVAGLKALRLVLGYGYIRRVRRECRTAAGSWVERAGELGRRLGIRRAVRVVESGLVRVPMVVGQLRPIIFIPLGLINHLPAGEMEAVLLHELAHIRRLDHVVNLVQQVVECLLFFNPGLLWISDLLREERENCCDDLAIEQTGDRVEFVRALVRFKEHSLGAIGLAFPGNRRQLLHRVLRISRQQNKGLNGAERVLLLGGLLSLLWLVAVRAGGPAVIQDHVKGAVTATTVQPQLLSVLQTRRQVAQNIEWVKAQLEEVRRRRPGGSDMGEKKAREAGRVLQDQQKALLVLRQLTVKTQQDQQSRDQAERDLHQAERDLVQAERDRQQAELVRQEALKDMEQKTKKQDQELQTQQQLLINREEMERNRRLALVDQNKIVRDQQEAVRDQQEAVRDRDQAVQNRRQAVRNQEQAERERVEKAERADRDRAAAGN